MLHRLALRVLPSLALAVTEESVRKRKRIVILVPGLVAFVFYRSAKQVVDLAEPATLLVVSGLIALITAACAYRAGRQIPFICILHEDRIARVLWVLGWIGFVYGLQLSLLVLALLWLVNYDYGLHPDGPAMMAIIISCTAVARDAFEIGHVRWLQSSGRPFATFPDGAALRTLMRESRLASSKWFASGLAICWVLAQIAATPVVSRVGIVVQLGVVTIAAGFITVFAYFDGQQRQEGWVSALVATSPGELLKFWWWPGLAFASTYYLVLLGAVLYPLQHVQPSPNLLSAAVGLVGGIMGLYGYYLGVRRNVEDRERQEVPVSLLRCPFVMGILGQSRSMVKPAGPETPARSSVI
jgi:hypothetical protein